MASTFFELDGEEIISSSLIIKELDFDQEIADIISQAFTKVEFYTPIEEADQWDIGDLSKPVLLKMAGYCKGGTSDSYWAIYLSGIDSTYISFVSLDCVRRSLKINETPGGRHD